MRNTRRTLLGGLGLYLLTGILLVAVAATTREAASAILRETPTFVGLVLVAGAYLLARQSMSPREAGSPAPLLRRRVLTELALLFAFVLVLRVPAVLLYARPLEKAPLLLLLAWLGTRLGPARLGHWGFTRWQLWPNVLFGLGLYGFGTLVIGGAAETAARLLTGEGVIRSVSGTTFLLQLPPQLLLVGLSEEGLFRGLMLTRLRSVFSVWPAIFLQAGFFGVWHFVWHLQPLDLTAMLGRIAFTFMFGLFAGYLVHLTGSLAAPTLYHGASNAAAASVILNPAFKPGEAPLTFLATAFFFLSFLGTMTVARPFARFLRVQRPPAELLP